MTKNNRYIICLILVVLFGINFSLVKQYDFYKASQLYKRGEYLKALKIYSRYKKRLSDEPDYLYDLGTVYIKLQQYKIALKYFHIALDKKPCKDTKFKLYFNMGLTYYLTGDTEKSVSFFEKSAIIKSENLIVKKNMELILKNMKKRTKTNEKMKKNEKKKENRISEPLLNYVNETEKETIKSSLKKKKQKREEKYW